MPDISFLDNKLSILDNLININLEYTKITHLECKIISNIVPHTLIDVQCIEKSTIDTQLQYTQLLTQDLNLNISIKPRQLLTQNTELFNSLINNKCDTTYKKQKNLNMTTQQTHINPQKTVSKYNRLLSYFYKPHTVLSQNTLSLLYYDDTQSEIVNNSLDNVFEYEKSIALFKDIPYRSYSN